MTAMVETIGLMGSVWEDECASSPEAAFEPSAWEAALRELECAEPVGSAARSPSPVRSQECESCSQLMVALSRQRCETGYWRAMHRKAHEREHEKDRRIEELEAKVKLRESQLFGKKSEKKGKGGAKGAKSERPKLPRGHQAGKPSTGRRLHTNAPAQEESWDLREEDKCCPACQKPLKPIHGTEDSELLGVDVKAHRRLIRRVRYTPSCKCRVLPGIVIAPGPAKLIPRGGYDISFWVRILLDKFLLQRPTERLLLELRLNLDVHISPGTVTDGLKRIAPLFEPLLAGIIEKNLSEGRWHADETRWLVFAELEGKNSHHWYLWLFGSPSTAVFYLDPSRSAEVPKRHFGEKAEGILNVDRYSAYKTLLEGGKIVLAFCWSHTRRDFLDVAKQWPSLESWALSWVERIGQLYAINNRRVLLLEEPQQFAQADSELRSCVEAMVEQRKAELAMPTLRPQSRKVLESLERHWDGLSVFIEHPEVPMDNNLSERQLRNPVIGRKNYYGAQAIWSGQLAAMLFSLFQTLLLWGINPKLWLTAYLEQCAEHGGKVPPGATGLLPWNLTPERLRSFQVHEPDPPNTS